MSSKYFRHYSLSIGALTVSIVATLIWSGFTLSKRIADIDRLWVEYSQRAIVASGALNRINTSLGYGGFIHNFKNYILRQEPQLIPQIEGDLHTARSAIASYRALEISTQEAEALQSVENMVNDYEEKFRLTRQLVTRGDTPSQIDARVRIDDLPALESILQLANQALERSSNKELETNEALKQTTHLIKWAGLLIPFVLLVGITTILFIRYVMQSNDKLETEQRYLDNLLDVAPDPMLTTDNQGRIIRANSEAAKLFGYSRDELCRMLVEDLIPTELRHKHTAYRRDYFHNPGLKHFSEKRPLTALTRDGRKIPVDISLSFLERGGELQAIATVRDTSKWIMAEEALRSARDELEQRVAQRTTDLAEAQRIAHIGNWRWCLETGELQSSVEVERIFGEPPATTCSSLEECFGLIHPDDQMAIRSSIRPVQTDPGQSCDVEFRITRLDGGKRYLHLRGESAVNEEGEVTHLIGTLQDITERKEAEQELRLADNVFSGTTEGIVVTNAEGTILRVNDAFTGITGYSAKEAIGRTPSILRSHRHDQAFYQELWSRLITTRHWEGEIWNRRKSGSLIPVRQSITAITDAKGEISQYIGIFSDITERKMSEERIRHLAHYDALTDLPNRLLFNARCEHALTRARRDGHQVAVLFMDLDRFKHINDSLGHPVGDALLKAVAERLTTVLREQDTVGRLGGDEFAVVVDEIGHPDDAALIAGKLLSVLNEPIKIGTYELHISTSVGISIFPDDAEDVPSLLKNADAAMYRAKDLGRSNYQYYTAELTEAAFDRIQLEGQLKLALEREQLYLHYQPQYSLTSGELTGCEALVRWQHPELGNIPPDKFIPLAEETGIIQALGQWVLVTACRQMKTWRDDGLEAGRIAVNLSGAQVQRDKIVEVVKLALEETGLDAQHLELEVTESFVMGYAEQAVSVLEGLENLGINLAIDDFGTGYSSLSYLKRLPFHKLKIDRSFVRDVPQDTNDEAIVRAVIALGNSMQLKVIAEGAETKGQIDFLKKEGCHEVQGYFLSRPLPANEVENVIRLHQANK
ncbi:MAG: EAL domain-containing protein [Candidatus Sedimenticola sp. (ex Thyasira tokunagai)]